VVVHCNSGKGRAGTSIVSILRFCGRYNNIDDALKYYAHKRFSDAKGVSQPC
jgi:phosphatidylinositol-3,4,5-trisphosphate 3-phosphatase/dual-specificity protein phosphatase PTEN